MEWLNLHSSVLDSEAVIGSEPVDRATWLFLLRYCIGQENGGVIRGALNWGDRRWQQLCRVTKDEVARATPLWFWRDADLVVLAYPADKEQEVRAKREGGRQGGQARTPAKAEAARLNGAKLQPKLNPSSDPTEGKGMEGNGREETPTPPPTPKPLSETKPGVMELGTILGLKLSQASMPKWLQLIEEVGVDVLRAARDEMIAAGRECWDSETAAVALRIARQRMRRSTEVVDRVTERALAAKRAADLENVRVSQHAEAVEFLNALSASGLEPECDQALLIDLRSSVAANVPGCPPIGGPFSTLAKLRLWFDTAGAPTPTERTA